MASEGSTTAAGLRRGVAAPKLRRGLAAWLVERLLKQIRQGRVRLVFGGWQRTYGDPRADLEGTLVVHDGSFFRDVALGGEVGLGRSYVEGKWSSPNLEDLALVFHLNIDVFLPMIRGGTVLLFAARWVEKLTQRWITGWRKSTLEHSRKGDRKSVV